jgi:hypothetical protein
VVAPPAPPDEVELLELEVELLELEPVGVQHCSVAGPGQNPGVDI